MAAPQYPKGDLRRMLAVLGAIETGSSTLVQIAAATGLDKKTVTNLIAQAGEQACVSISKSGASYSLESWGPVLKRDGTKLALTGALNAPIIGANRRNFMGYGSNQAVKDAEDDYKEECALLIARTAAELVAAGDTGRLDAIERATEWLRNEQAADGDPTGVTAVRNKEPLATKDSPEAQIRAIAAELLDDARDAADSL